MLGFIVERKEGNTLYIDADKEGLAKLIDWLSYLSQLKEADHIHLMSPAWGGEEEIDDVSELITDEYEAIHHVKISFQKKD